MNRRSAFTLVELAIVLVIIGLIVGGVLVGQDLIKTAQIRSVVTDIERYNAAANTFREKYKGLPGDLLNTRAVQFGFNTAANDAARDGSNGSGDGDGKIEGLNEVNDDTPMLKGETLLFWADLSKAGLISFSATATSITATTVPDMNAAQLAQGFLPSSKLRSSALFAVFSCNAGQNCIGNNRYGLAQFFTYFSALYFSPRDGGGTILEPASAHGITPIEALALDSKLDDGNPLTGDILANRETPSVLDTTGSPCVDASGNYNTSTDILATADACSLSIRAAF